MAKGKCVVVYTVSFSECFEILAESEQDDVIATIEILMERGVNLPFPYSSAIAGSRYGHMRELRIQSGGNAIRVFYAFDPKRNAVLLTGGVKRGNQKRFYKQQIAIADAAYEAHLATLKKK